MNKFRTRKSTRLGAQKFETSASSFRKSANAGKVSPEILEEIRGNLGIPVDSYLQFLQGKIQLEPPLLQQLETEFRQILLEQENFRKGDEKRRGGIRVRAGRKSEGNSSRIVRITASPQDMKLIERWLKQAPDASKRLARLILQNVV